MATKEPILILLLTINSKDFSIQKAETRGEPGSLEAIYVREDWTDTEHPLTSYLNMLKERYRTIGALSRLDGEKS